MPREVLVIENELARVLNARQEAEAKVSALMDRVKYLRDELVKARKYFKLQLDKDGRRVSQLPLRKAQEDLRALRLNAARALRERGASIAEIQEIFGVSYAMIRQAQAKIEDEARRDARRALCDDR